MLYNERERESPRTHCLHLFIIVFHTKSRNLLEAKQQKHFWFGCNRYIILHNQALQALQVHCFAMTRAFTDYIQYDTLPRVSRIVIVTRYKLLELRMESSFINFFPFFCPDSQITFRRTLRVYPIFSYFFSWLFSLLYFHP